MWSIEDLHELNPPEPDQSTSFLSQLLAMGATTPLLLSEFACVLESRGGPFVAAFAQIPFDLGLGSVGSVQIVAPGDAPHSTVELRLRPCIIGIDPFGRLLNITEADPDVVVLSSTVVTQVIGLIRLGDMRARIHEVYVNHLSPLGLLSEPLGNHKIENWMRLPQAQLQEPLRRRPPLTGHDFQRDVAARARDHLLFAVNAALHAYSVANLEELPQLEYLYGYHIMIAPGRIACANAPRPVIAGLLSTRRTGIHTSVFAHDAFDILKSRLRLEDPVVRQLQAMNRLLCEGEASLALVGCVTAIEWFLNARFPNLGRVTRHGERRSASVSSFLVSEHAKLLAPGDRDFLRLMVDARNAITHGAPPERRQSGKVPTVHSDFVRDALFVALSVYRSVNTHTHATASPQV